MLSRLREQEHRDLGFQQLSGEEETLTGQCGDGACEDIIRDQPRLEYLPT